jgi:hypothetical protein
VDAPLVCTENWSTASTETAVETVLLVPCWLMLETGTPSI